MLRITGAIVVFYSFSYHNDEFTQLFNRWSPICICVNNQFFIYFAKFSMNLNWSFNK